jgi:hypothetical protein
MKHALGGMSHTALLMLSGIHSTKYEEFLFCCIFTSHAVDNQDETCILHGSADEPGLNKPRQLASRQKAYGQMQENAMLCEPRLFASR